MDQDLLMCDLFIFYLKDIYMCPFMLYLRGFEILEIWTKQNVKFLGIGAKKMIVYKK